MASPHVAGSAAVYLEANPGSTPADVLLAMTAGAIVDAIIDPNDSPNLLLYQEAAPIEPDCVVDADCPVDLSGCTDASCSAGVCLLVDNGSCECTQDAHCDDADSCTDDVCNADNTCSTTDNGSCCLDAIDCSDGTICTDDVCHADGSCSNPDNASCPSCSPSGQSCSSDGDCCSLKCHAKGKKANTCA